MKRSDKVIVTCAMTGSIHTPSMSDALPVTPERIAAEAVAAAEAGAAILHLHARDPADGRPTSDPEIYRLFLPEIASRTDAILNITTGGGLGMTLDERLAAAKRFRPELASMNMGSFNFNIAASAAKVATFRHAWERPYLEGTTDLVMSNTFAQIERGLRELGENGTRFEFECYDVGHLYNLAHCVDRRLVEPPFFIQCVFGVLGGIGPEPENLMHMRATADRLFGADYLLSVLAAGRHQMRFATMGAILGGNLRVGLEDSLFIGRGRLAASNAEQVAKVRRILEALSLDLATPDEARALLRTKWRGDAAF